MLVITSLHAESPRNLPHYSAAEGRPDHAGEGAGARARPARHPRNAIAPGAIPGGGFSRATDMADRIALKRFGTPADVAAMAVAVLSERFGAYVTGATMVVDGGIALHNWIDP